MQSSGDRALDKIHYRGYDLHPGNIESFLRAAAGGYPRVKRAADMTTGEAWLAEVLDRAAPGALTDAIRETLDRFLLEGTDEERALAAQSNFCSPNAALAFLSDIEKWSGLGKRARPLALQLCRSILDGKVSYSPKLRETLLADTLGTRLFSVAWIHDREWVRNNLAELFPDAPAEVSRAMNAALIGLSDADKEDLKESILQCAALGAGHVKAMLGHHRMGPASTNTP